jgi:hypothetical protein
VPYAFNATLFEAVQTGKFHDVYKGALANAGEKAETARIPVEKSNAAVLLLSGKKDQIWPSTAMCETIIEQLEQAKFRHPFKHVAYDTNHYVGIAREHWIEITTFLRKHYRIEDQTKP